jgi:hypothetical protein
MCRCAVWAGGHDLRRDRAQLVARGQPVPQPNPALHHGRHLALPRPPAQRGTY